MQVMGGVDGSEIGKGSSSYRHLVIPRSKRERPIRMSP